MPLLHFVELGYSNIKLHLMHPFHGLYLKHGIFQQTGIATQAIYHDYITGTNSTSDSTVRHEKECLQNAATRTPLTLFFLCRAWSRTNPLTQCETKLT